MMTNLVPTFIWSAIFTHLVNKIKAFSLSYNVPYSKRYRALRYFVTPVYSFYTFEPIYVHYQIDPDRQ